MFRLSMCRGGDEAKYDKRISLRFHIIWSMLLEVFNQTVREDLRVTFQLQKQQK